MPSVTRSFGVALVAVATVVVVEAATAATAIQKCEVAKLKAASKEVHAEMACYAKAKKTAAPVDSTCLTHAQTNADTTINTADGACAGTASDIDAAIDSCLSAFLTDAPGNGACPALSAKVIGNGAKRELACQAKEVTSPGTFTTCDTREDGKTTAALGRPGGGTPCVSITSVMTDIDNCDTAIDALVTTTTTTTTTFPPCTNVGTACGGCGSGACLSTASSCCGSTGLSRCADTFSPPPGICVSFVSLVSFCATDQDCANIPGAVCVAFDELENGCQGVCFSPCP
jgi:hypothetical protein